jgi:hypothetical protein
MLCVKAESKHHMETTNTTPTQATTALIVWNAQTEAQVRTAISTGNSVSKALFAAAPKGFIKGLREIRSKQLQAQSSELLGGFQDRGFKIVAATAVKELKDGRQTVTLRLSTGKATKAMTMAEYAESVGMTVDEVTGMIDINRNPAPTPTRSANPALPSIPAKK